MGAGDGPGVGAGVGGAVGLGVGGGVATVGAPISMRKRRVRASAVSSVATASLLAAWTTTALGVTPVDAAGLRPGRFERCTQCVRSACAY